MADNIGKRKGIPAWNGDLSLWPKYREDMQIWMDGEDLDSKFCWASRCIQNLSGSARRAALAIPKADLQPFRRPRRPASNAADGSDVPVPDDDASEEDLARGIKNLLAHLERTLQPSESIRKGQSMEAVFAQADFSRKRGEAIRDFITRFDRGLSEMRENGVDIESIPDLAGWWFVRFLNLSEERRERITSALPDEHMALPDVKKVCVRIFSDLRIQELTEDSVSQAQKSLLRSRARDFDHTLPGAPLVQRPKQTLTTEQLDNDDDSDSTFDQADFQNACRQELDAFMAALEARGGYPAYMTPDEIATADEAATAVAAASEAVSTLRAARSALCTEQNKGKGKGKGKPDGPAVDYLHSRRGGRNRADHYATLQQSIAQRKARSRCKICNGYGHWAGDVVCPGVTDGEC